MEKKELSLDVVQGIAKYAHTLYEQADLTMKAGNFPLDHTRELVLK